MGGFLPSLTFKSFCLSGLQLSPGALGTSPASLTHFTATQTQVLGLKPRGGISVRNTYSMGGKIVMKMERTIRTIS